MSSFPQLIAASGQAAVIEGLQAGAIVKVDGQTVAANADGSYPVPPNRDVTLSIEQGGKTVTRRVRVAATEVARVDIRPEYPFGSPDYLKNRAAIGKFQMSIFSLCVIGAAIGGIVAATRD